MKHVINSKKAVMIGCGLSLIHIQMCIRDSDELIQYLDDIISGLRYQDGHYDLIRLKDETYREKLDVQSAYWEQLKEEIADVRQKGYENTDIVAMSETYFDMADATVFAAEDYSQQIAEKIRTDVYKRQCLFL